MRHDVGCELPRCHCENGRIARLEEEARTLLELNRVKSGDSLTRFDPPLELGIVFAVAERTLHGSIIGYELHGEGGAMLLVGHLNERGSDFDGEAPNGRCVAARKVWLGA